MDEKDKRWFNLVGWIALIAWPIYWLYRRNSRED